MQITVFLAQVRADGEQSWRTVGEAPTRAEAAQIAAEAYVGAWLAHRISQTRVVEVLGPPTTGGDARV